MSAVISATPGDVRTGVRHLISPARSACSSPPISSPGREATSGTANRLRLYAAEPRRARRRARCVVSELSTQRHLHRRHFDLHLAGLGPESYSETVLHSGTVRGRIGYAPGNWLIYATGGFAWTYDQLTLTQLATTRRSIRHSCGDWVGPPEPASSSGRAELDGERRVSVHGLRQQQRDLSERRAAVHIRFFPAPAARRAELSVRQRRRPNAMRGSTGLPTPATDLVNFHGQTTFVWQGYPAIRSPIRAPTACPAGRGPRNLRRHALRRRPAVARRRGVDQSGDRSGLRFRQHARRRRISERQAYKLGSSYPYARLHARFLRQTINLGGERRRSRPTSISSPGLADGEPPGADGRQVRHRRHLRHQQIRQQPEDRLSELVADQRRHVRLCRRRLGLHLRRGRRVVPGLLDVARRRLRPVGNARGRRSAQRPRPRPDLQPVPGGRRNRGTAPAVGPARQAQGHRLSEPRPCG